MHEQFASIDIIEQIGRLSPDGYLVYNFREDIVLYANSAMVGILGVSELSRLDVSQVRQEILEDDVFITKYIGQLTHDQRLNNVELGLRNGRTVSVDAYLLRKQVLAVLVVKDITNAKQFSDYMSEFGARKDALLDMLSHNLTGPLNLTNNLLNLIDLPDDPQQYKLIDSHTRLIRENTQKCIEIINSFLKEEHLTSPNIYVESNRFDVIEKINIVLERIRPFVDEKDIRVHSNADHIFINSDDVKFFQSIHNIISNAVKFTLATGKVSIEVIDLEDYVVITVEDDGIGIPEHLQPFVFQRNTPAARPGLKGEKSLGMGLYVAKRLIGLMNGHIAIESAENTGTKATVSVPKIRQLQGELTD